MTETEALRLGRRGLWAGGAGLLTSVALGVALVAASWSNYRGARAAYETLNRGQVEILQHALRGALGGRAEGVDSLELQAAVEANREAGLRYLALLQPDGTVAVDAGEPIAPVQVPASFL